ncbi:hypothetical protein GCM10008908_00440 [Clostridium subterminale]|uniref:Transcriptional regulator TetR C-terminal Firmicutes type domain-containing protein n=1 Tax=Clostridium subterminale TaxID=1550 RepID=A0ABP3VSY3_CLOSU
MVKNGLFNGNPYLILLNIYNYVKENKQFFKLIMSESGDPSFYYKLNETMKETIYDNMDIKRLKIPVHYAIGFQTSLINDWIKTDMKETPEEIVKIITEIMHDVPKSMYEYYKE